MGIRDRETVGQIGRGYMVLLGIEDVDTEQDADYICDKIIGLRVFEDDQGKMCIRDSGSKAGRPLPIREMP